MTDRDGLALWRAALAAFVLAGATGLLFRLGAFGALGALHPVNVRHAHSHLMFFSWATPALMALVQAHLPPSRAMRRATWASLVLGFVAYVPFLLYGYGVAPVGGARLPLSVIASTANIFAWYVFAYGYVRATRRLARTAALRLWDGAVALLVVCTLGAWLLGLLQMRGGMTEFALEAALHLFLNLFAEGWFVLALLGVLHAQHSVEDRAGDRAAALGTTLAAWALPLTFLLGVRVALVPPDLRAISGAAGLAVAAGLLLHAWALRRPGAARGPLVYLALRAAMLVGASLAPLARWGEAEGLRILYLHVLLLGFVSVGLVEAARRTWGAAAVPGRRAFGLAVALVLASLVLASLVPLTGVWPDAWRGAWTWQAVALTAALPPAVAMGMAVRARRSQA